MKRAGRGWGRGGGEEDGGRREAGAEGEMETGE